MTTVAIHWKGAPTFRRIVEGVEWGPDNGHTADAPIELAADLLTGRESELWELSGKPKAGRPEKSGRVDGTRAGRSNCG